jgi:predicted nucleic acid-binding protein
MIHIRRGEVTAQTNALFISEVVYTLQTFCRVPKTTIVESLMPLITLPNLRISAKGRLRRALERYTGYNLSFVDAYLAVQVREQQIPELVSFDRNYDRVPGSHRVEP